MALLLIPGLAQAVVCKSVGEDGVVSYTDVPLNECEQKVDLPDYSRYSPRPIDRPAPSSNQGADAQVAPFSGYRSFRFTEPAAGGTVRSNEGQVTVVMDLEPALQNGHKIRLTLDGEAVSGTFDGLAVELSNIDRGSHSLDATVVDASGSVLVRASPVQFTLRKTGLFDRAPRPAPPPG